MKRLFLLLITLLISVGFLYGCSGTPSPTSPGLDDMHLGACPGLYGSGHQTWGIWEVLVDADGITATPVTDRFLSGAVHFNVKIFLKPPYCNDCLSFSNVSDDPGNQILSADVTLKNPYPLAGADVRGILISNNPEIYLTNPDDYTTLYDTDDPPDKNPFRLFGKDLTDGIVDGGTEITEHFEIHYPSIPFLFKTAVDAIYPADSLREPYAISNQTIEGVMDIDGKISRKFELDVFDRHDDAGAVSVVCEDLGIDITMVKQSGMDNHYFVFLNNSKDAPVGEYIMQIAAFDSTQPWVLYDYFTITVVEEVGDWVIEPFPLPNSGCPRDIASGYCMLTGEPRVFFTGGTSCEDIMIVTPDFLDPGQYFNLVDIDPLISGFSPNPARRMDVSLAGGIAFFADSDAPYDDGFYSGLVSSLMITLFPDIDGLPQYINNGDGDSSRMVPNESTLKGVDISNDNMGSLYGFWADPDGIHPPEIYGLYPDYTRHDIFMGGILPPELVGEGSGKISPNYSQIKAIAIGDFTFETGYFYMLETDGTSSEIEIFYFEMDYITQTTNFGLHDTISLGEIDAVDIDTIICNPLYCPNPDYSSLVVLVQGASGGYVRMYNTVDLALVDEIGSESEPVISGNATCVDCENGQFIVMVANQEGDIVSMSWEI